MYRLIETPKHTRLLTYDPSIAIGASGFGKGIHTENLLDTGYILTATKTPEGLIEAARAHPNQDVMLINLTYFYTAVEGKEGPDSWMERRGEIPVSLGEILSAAKEAQKITGVERVLIDHYTTFQGQGAQMLYFKSAAYQKPNQKMLTDSVLPYSKSEIAAEFDGKIGFIKRCYSFEELTEAVDVLTGRKKRLEHTAGNSEVIIPPMSAVARNI